MKRSGFFKQFNWRFLLVRILANAIALAVTAAIVPKIYFVDKSALNWLLMAIMLGVLNALVKPVLQFLTLQFLFVTYGLTIVVINAVILLLLSLLFPDRFAVDNLLWALVGGLVLGLVSAFLESLLGLTMPIVPDEPAELRQQVEEQARQVDWLTGASTKSALEEQALVTEPLAAESPAPEAMAAESLTPELDEGPSPPAEVEAEALEAAEMPPAEAGVSVDPQTAPEPRDEQKEGRS